VKTFKHRGKGGDMIYGLATMYNLGGGILHLNFGPVYKSFLETQPYIKKVVYHDMNNKEWNDLSVDYNLDLFRKELWYVYTLLECHAMAFKLKFDLTKPWLFNIKPKYIADIVINRTERYDPVSIDWEQLRGFENRSVFIGSDRQYENFCKDKKYKIRKYEIKGILEFVQVIKGSNLYLGNQSTGLALAEGLKIPRVADIYSGDTKQYPKGKNGHFKLSKKLIESYIN